MKCPICKEQIGFVPGAIKAKEALKLHIAIVHNNSNPGKKSTIQMNSGNQFSGKEIFSISSTLIDISISPCYIGSMKERAEMNQVHADTRNPLFVAATELNASSLNDNTKIKIHELIKHDTKNYCTIFALSNAAKIPYYQAYMIMHEVAGRKNKHGVNMYTWLKGKGWRFAELKFKNTISRNDEHATGWTKGTMSGTRARKNFPFGRFVILIKGHALAMVNGQFIDNAPRKRYAIRAIFEINKQAFDEWLSGREEELFVQSFDKAAKGNV